MGHDVGVSGVLLRRDRAGVLNLGTTPNKAIPGFLGTLLL